jgi:tetratricopeptide (TPR) repeat protein
MKSKIFDYEIEKYINTYADEKEAESLMRPFALLSNEAFKQRAAMEARNDVHLMQKRLTNGVELMQDQKIIPSSVDQELLRENLEKIMQLINSFTNSEELEAVANTWASPDRTFNLSDDFYHLLVRMGSELIVQKREKELADFYLLIAVLFPYKATTWVRLGEIEQNLGRLQEAQMMYMQAILIDFHVCSAHLHMTECLIELGDRDGAHYSLQIAEFLLNGNDDKKQFKYLLNKINNTHKKNNQ